ncbi:hypothetical protein H5410_064596 [Solanum commersonii]|uniref:Uncharacterized protein n=1 Tax=Solanum commersonii TaxID=4109 RepID=A0A9J5VZ90_SOLCO|nr:hypothetical protein H5410_064596 [Solanum commersonii]
MCQTLFVVRILRWQLNAGTTINSQILIEVSNCAESINNKQMHRSPFWGFHFKNNPTSFTWHLVATIGCGSRVINAGDSGELTIL